MSCSGSAAHESRISTQLQSPKNKSIKVRKKWGFRCSRKTAKKCAKPHFLYLVFFLELAQLLAHFNALAVWALWLELTYTTHESCKRYWVQDFCNSKLELQSIICGRLVLTTNGLVRIVLHILLHTLTFITDASWFEIRGIAGQQSYTGGFTPLKSHIVTPRTVRSISVRSKWAGLGAREGTLLHLTDVPNRCPAYVSLSL